MSELTLRIPAIPEGQRFTLVRTEVDAAVAPAGTPLGSLTWRRHQRAATYAPTIDLLARLQDAVVDGRPLPEHVVHDGASLWPFLPSYVTPELYRAVELARLVADVVDESAPDALRAVVEHPRDAELWRGVVEGAAQRAGIPWTVVGEAAVPSRRRRFASSRLGGLARFVFDVTFDVAAAVATRRQPRSAGERHLLFGTYPRLWQQRPFGEGPWDEQLSPLLPALQADGWRVTGLDLNYAASRRHALGVVRARLGATSEVTWRVPPLNRGVVRPWRAGRRLARTWAGLAASPDLDAVLRVAGVPLLPAVRGCFARAFRHDLAHVCVLLDRAPGLLEGVDAVALSYETGPLQRALLVAAARQGIPTFGLQHGTIRADHYEYVRPRVGPGADGSTTDAPVPDVTAVWGSTYGDALTVDGTYPDEAVAVIGHWRYDALLHQVTADDRERVRRALDLRPGDRAVLVTTSEQRSAEFVRHCLDAVAGHDDVVVLVKPHPSEPVAPVAEALEGAPVRTVLLRDRLLEALSIADLVVSQPSTTISEAIAFGRPTIVGDFQYDPADAVDGWVDLRRSGTCAYAYEPATLVDLVRRALDGEAISDPGTQEAFVERYFGVLDGRVAERFAAVIASRLP